ncbi:MAG TPA: glycosyltransferase [Campylobacterales bacterium]|nr:glycosyltransferase [Campylobacterales bacterium]
MISFIVIGMNEAKTIGLTIKSIKSYISYNEISEYEIIYIDSRSTDNSIEIVKKFKNVKIFQIRGDMNAAIARNIGAVEAKGEIFIFLDGDMEIQKEFHKIAFNEKGLIYPFISGQLKNIFYNDKWSKIDENLHFPKLKKDSFYPETGGFFMIERNLWFLVGGMKTKYRRSQDIDLALRLAKRGTLLLRKKELFIIHHTINYLDKRRVWKMLFNGSLLFQTSVMIRDHIFNPHIYKKFLRTSYTLIVLLISTIFGLFLSPYFLLIHPIVVGVKILMIRKPIELFIYYYLRDIFSFLGLFLFFPKEKKLIYTLIK